MIRHKRLIRARQHAKLKQEQKPGGDVKMIFGKWKRLNPETGKYDLKA